MTPTYRVDLPAIDAWNRRNHRARAEYRIHPNSFNVASTRCTPTQPCVPCIVAGVRKRKRP